MIVEYAHFKLNEPVESISGRYVIENETTIRHNGREALVAFGHAVVDNSCCGAAGCRFANVAGYVTAWKKGVGRDGSSLSEVEPIQEEEAKKEIRERIKEVESYCQVNFL